MTDIHRENYEDPGTKRLTEAPSIDPSAQVRDSRLGRYCEVGARTKIAESTFGDFSYIGEDSDVIYTTVGKFCSIAAHTRINPGNHSLDRVALHHFTYRASAYGFGADEASFFDWRRSQPVTIGNDVWIGHGAIILPGITVGHGAAIGAGTVVTHDVSPFAIVVGVPARLLRFRFSAPIIESLQRIAWWDWQSSELKTALLDFQQSDAATFCTKYDPEFQRTD